MLKFKAHALSLQILRNFAALCSSVLKYLSVFVSSSMALKIRRASVKFRCAKKLSPMRQSAFMRAIQARLADAKSLGQRERTLYRELKFARAEIIFAIFVFAET